MTRRVFVTGLVCTWALLMSTVAFAQKGDDAFKRAMEARSRRSPPSEVATQLQAAIDAEPRESARKIRYGGFLRVGGEQVEYVPHYFLAEAYYEQGLCARAVEQWIISEQQGVIQQTPFIKTLRDHSRECESRGVLLAADFKDLSASSRQAYDSANELANKVRTMLNSNQTAAGQPMRDLYEKARNELDAAQKLLVRAPDSRLRKDFVDAEQATGRARDLLVRAESGLTAAIENLSRVDRQSREVEQVIAEAEKTNSSLNSLEPLPQDLHSLRMNALETLTQARDRLTAGQRSQNPATLDEAAKYAQSALGRLKDVADQISRVARAASEQKLQDAVKALEDLFSLIDAKVASIERLFAERPSAATPELRDQREKLRTQIDRFRRQFDRARATDDLLTVESTSRRTAQLQTSLDEIIQSFGPPTLRDRGVEPALETGVRLYFNGEYQNTIAALEPLRPRDDVPLKLHVHLFLAASHYALWVQSASRDASHRAAAIADIARCKELNSTFQPDPRFFSPAFIAFYRQPDTAAAAAPANPTR